MSNFIVTFDNEFRKEVMGSLKVAPGAVVIGQALRNGTVRIKTTTRDLDSEANAIHAVEDIQGVLDVRLLES